MQVMRSYIICLLTLLMIVGGRVSPLNSAPLQTPLSKSDAIIYKQIFALQEDGQIKAAAKLIKKLNSDLLIGHVLSQKYLHPTAWRSSFAELSSWLSLYYDHPAASRIKWLSDRRKPSKAKAARAPKKGYLNGVGLSKPQSYRAVIPQSWAGRQAPRITAKIARDIRRAIRRGHPSGALELLNKSTNLRYLTAIEEAHLRGEIAHAYFIFGVDDKAVRVARQAIAKGGEEAFMGYWAGGIAAWRAKRFELATSFFSNLALLENAPDLLRAGAAFWTHRALLRAGDPASAAPYQEIATRYPESFYGAMAIQSSGQIQTLNFDLPEISDDFINWLPAQKGGKRALALLQIGNWTQAARELRYLFEDMPEEFRVDFIVFAAKNAMPGLAFRLADIYQRDTGITYLAALYPFLETEAEFRVDKALVLAIIRKESGFYPLARSRAKAAGLMQILPSTAAYISRDRRYQKTHRHKLHNPEVNLELGQDYIQYLFKGPQVQNDLVRMLAAYNGGPGNLKRWLAKLDHGDDPFLLIESIPARETRNYIKGVISYLYIYRSRLDEPMPALQQLISGKKTDRPLVLSSK